jgi:hypothetical protein
LQACRFHITYPTFESDWNSNLWDDIEQNIAYDVRDGELEEEDVTRCVELTKTIRMLSDKDQTHCEDCEPLFIDTPNSKEWCICNLHSHFVEPWRCIPCVLVEEAQLVTSQQNFATTYDPTQPRKWMYSKVCCNSSQKLGCTNPRTTDNILRLWERRGRAADRDM